MAGVYLAFADADRAQALRLARVINDLGFAVTTADDTRPGEDAQAGISRAILRADRVVVLWTPNALAEPLRSVVRHGAGKLINVTWLTDAPPGVEGPVVPVRTIEDWDLPALGQRLSEALRLDAWGDPWAGGGGALASAAAPPPMAAPSAPPPRDPLEDLRMARFDAAQSGAAPFAGGAAEISVGVGAGAASAAPPAGARSRPRRMGGAGIVGSLAAVVVAAIGAGTLLRAPSKPAGADESTSAASASAPSSTASAPTAATPVEAPPAAVSPAESQGDMSGSSMGGSDATNDAAAEPQPPPISSSTHRHHHATRHRKPVDERVVLGVAAAAGGSRRGRATGRPEPVDVSAFATDAVRAGASALVQIYLHPIDGEAQALARARLADPATRSRGVATLNADLAPGSRVAVVLSAGDLEVDEPAQWLVWNGRPTACQFVVSAPAGAAIGDRVLVARLMVDDAPVGRLAFTLKVVGAEAAADPRHTLRGDNARRYSRAFLSYSSPDRPEVVKSAQALRAAGIDYFQDILSIEPGEAWRERLFAEIDRCDLFLLFWSRSAAQSEWVLREAEYAMGRKQASGDQSPDITPIVIDGPPIPTPPASLSELHFNDMLRYVIAATEAEARERGA